MCVSLSATQLFYTAFKHHLFETSLYVFAIGCIHRHMIYTRFLNKLKNDHEIMRSIPAYCDDA